MPDPTPPSAPRTDATRLAELEREKAALTERLQDAEASLERVRWAYTHALEQLQLLRRRLYVASAERAEVDAAQLAFDAMFEQAQTLSKALGAAAGDEDGATGTTRDRRPSGRARPRRRDAATWPRWTCPWSASS